MAVRPPNQALGARPTGAVVLADGTAFFGHGAGATGAAVGELCFNTAMTGYQEILSDPSYARQIVLFTFPHIGNVGANPDDVETSSPPAETAAVGTVMRAPITASSNWRATAEFDAWLAQRGIVGVTGVDTRAITRRIREHGMPHAVVAHDANGAFDVEALAGQARAWAGIEGADLAIGVTAKSDWVIAETAWDWPTGHGPVTSPRFHVVVLDYGVKKNILRRLGSMGARATVMRADAPADAVLAKKPDGVLLANGPGDPAATAGYAADTVRALIKAGLPVFGICLGHQLLALALGAKTAKMPQGHHGANHPVKDLRTGHVQIVSMNHGFTVDRTSLPKGVVETHVSLFDGTNAGLAVEGKPVFSVQHHPEASPGPHDAFNVFDRFAEAMASVKTPA